MAKVSLVDDVVQQLAENPVGVQPWYRKVSRDHADTLAELLEAWKSGRLGKHRMTAARAISKILRDRGIANVGPQGVDVWLQRA